MRKLLCLALGLGFVMLGVAQDIKRTPAQMMVDTELAFAKMSLDEGTRPAFLAFIADDGILFRPRAVKGKQWMIDHPLPAPTPGKRSLLSWYPAVADMASAGDMGYTTGPWEFKNDIKDAKPVAFGNFLTVWKRQADGKFKFAIDLGISNPQPAQVIAPWKQSMDTKPSTKNANVETTPSMLSAVDSEFAKESVTRGSQMAFTQFAAESVRVFRNNHQPFVGKAAAMAALPESANVWNWEPAFADVSMSGDLGYTYGTYRILKKDALPTVLETGNYFRVWKKQGDKWLVVTDLLDPVKEEKPN